MLFKCTLPIEPIRAADAVCEAVRTGYAEYQQRREALPHPDPIEDGRLAVLDAEQQANALQSSLRKMIDEACAEIDEHALTYAQAVHRQIMPQGAQIDNPDYALLRDELITTPEQLAMLVDTYAGNYTMSAQIARYADSREWTGFEMATNALDLLNFGIARFELCKRACRAPDGLSMAQQKDAGELERMAEAYNVLEELRAAVNGQ